MKTAKRVISYLLIVFLAACSDETSEDIQAFDKELSSLSLSNIAYGDDPAQTFDIYLPAARSGSLTKVLVLIHGGGWVQGDKNDMRDYIPMLQRENPDHAIVNLNYRLAIPNVRTAFPNQFLDLELALKYLSGAAAALEIKPEFGLIGVSAGGHLALQYDYLYDVKDQVKMIASIVGPTNFKDPFYSQNANFNFAMGYLIDKSAYPGISDLAKAVSPAYLVNENSSPTILFYGEDDELVPVNNGIFLKERLDAAGIVNSLTIYSGGHGDWQESSNKDLQLQLNEFIDLHLSVN